MRDVVGREESCEDVANETSDGVLGEDIEGVINMEDILEPSEAVRVCFWMEEGGGDLLGGIVGTSGTEDTVDDGSPGRNETGTRSNGNETSDDTGAETDSGPLALKTVIENTPCDTTDTGSKVGNNSSHDSAHIGSKSRSSVETEPSNPEENGADDDVGYVMRTVVELMGAVTTTLAQHDGVCECSTSRGNMHWGSTGKIEASELEDPAGAVPSPAGNRVVDDGRPDEHEDNGRKDATSLRNGSNSECDGNSSEHALVDSEEKIWNLCGSNGRSSKHISEAEVFKVTNVLAG